jgi:hypothetical protein
MIITGHTVEKLEDPFGILSGDRYEFFLDIDVDEEDDLFSEKGLGIKVIYVIDENGARISHYHFFEKVSEIVLDFALEDEEEEQVKNYCAQNIDE